MRQVAKTTGACRAWMSGLPPSARGCGSRAGRVRVPWWNSSSPAMRRTAGSRRAALRKHSLRESRCVMSENTVPIRILTVDDHALVRAGVASLIAGQSDMTLVGEASNGLEAIELFRLRRPSVTLMDLQMPVMCGIDAITAIRSEFPTARIIALTTYAGVHLAQRALKAGALAYLLKGNIHEDFLDTIRAVNAGGR